MAASEAMGNAITREARPRSPDEPAEPAEGPPVLELPMTRLKVVGTNIVHETPEGVCCFHIPLPAVDRVEVQPTFDWTAPLGMVVWTLVACGVTRLVPDVGWVYLIWMAWGAIAIGAIIAFLTARKLVLLSNGEPVAVSVQDPAGVVPGFVLTVERLMADSRRA